jgi:hypothetical protein
MLCGNFIQFDNFYLLLTHFFLIIFHPSVAKLHHNHADPALGRKIDAAPVMAHVPACVKRHKLYF